MDRTVKLSRRSFLGTVVGGAAVAGAMGQIAPARAETMQPCSDSDSGPRADPANRGRNCRSPAPTPTPAGCNDSDPSDPAGRGRSCGGWRITRVEPPADLRLTPARPLWSYARPPITIRRNQAEEWSGSGQNWRFLYNGRWYNLIGTDGATLVGTDGAT
jgi:hypothetical protein